jgi:hypothetical protein
MSRAFCIPGVIFIFCALVLNFLVSISLPFLPALDIARTHFENGVVANSEGLTEIRFGIWSACYYDSHDDRTCLTTGHAYTITITKNNSVAIVDASWTRGLAVHPVATVVTAIAFLFSLSTHITVTLIASLFSFLAALLTLIAFAIDIALFALVMHEMERLGTGVTTKAGPGFWLTLAAFILLLLGGCTVCFGRRRDRLSGATTTSASGRPFWQRFRRNKA